MTLTKQKTVDNQSNSPWEIENALRFFHTRRSFVSVVRPYSQSNPKYWNPADSVSRIHKAESFFS